MQTQALRNRPVGAATILTLIAAIATVATAWATIDYARYQREPNVSAFFEGDANWIFLVIQNTGSDVAREIRFSHDLTQTELADMFGPHRHGQRYIVFQELQFLNHYKSLAPGQRIRHQWLFLPLALRDLKPRPFTFTVSFDDKWGLRHEAHASFHIGMFGTWDTAVTPKARPEEVVARKLDELTAELRTLNRREELLQRRRIALEGKLERAEWMAQASEASNPPSIHQSSVDANRVQ
jgi:hypothetical protein